MQSRSLWIGAAQNARMQARMYLRYNVRKHRPNSGSAATLVANVLVIRMRDANFWISLVLGRVTIIGEAEAHAAYAERAYFRPPASPPASRSSLPALDSVDLVARRTT